MKTLVLAVTAVATGRSGQTKLAKRGTLHLPGKARRVSHAIAGRTITVLLLIGALSSGHASENGSAVVVEGDGRHAAMILNREVTGEKLAEDVVARRKDGGSAKPLTRYESATISPGGSASFVTTLSSVYTHSGQSFLYVVSSATPLPDFLSYAVSGVSSPSGYDYAYLLGMTIYADDGTYLGTVSTDRYSSDSIMNEYGTYGSQYGSQSIMNQYGTYGGAYAAQSPFNKYSSTPPILYSGSTGIAYLTTNTFKTPRCDPNLLITYLSGDAPGGSATVGHTVSVASDAPAGTYQFEVIYGFYSEGNSSLLVDAESVILTVTVQSANNAPVLSGIGDRVINEGETLSIQLSASDADGDGLTYEGQITPGGPATSGTATLIGSAFNWTPSYDEAGVYAVVFTVSDGNGGQDGEALQVTVNDVNRNPSLASITDRTIAEGETLALVLSGSDPDGDALTYVGYIDPSGPADAGTATLYGTNFNWTPGFDEAGSYALGFTASDGKGGEATQTMTVVVTDINRAPTLSDVVDQTVSEGETLTISLVGSDPDGDTISYSVSGSPTGASISGSTFTWTPSHDQSGTYVLTFSVGDGKGLLATDEVTLTVMNTNRPPSFTTIGDQSVAEGEALTLDLSAVDADGDTLTFAASGIPPGSSLIGPTFTWTPSADQAGSHVITFIVSDAKGGEDTQDITVTITDVNRAPALVTIGDQTTSEGIELSVIISASDADGDSLVYSISDGPAGASFDENEFRWIPDSDQAGEHVVVFTVTDGNGGEVSESITIHVGDVNRAPVLSSIGDLSIAEGEELVLALSGSDPDGDALSYSVSNSPDGSSLLDSVFIWDTSNDGAGSYSITFTVSDGQGGEASELVMLTVSDVNQAPVLATIGDQTITEGQELSITLSASDPDGDELSYSVSEGPPGSVMTDSTFSWLPGGDQAGSYTISFTVNDAKGGEASESLTINVTDVNRAPVLASIGNKSTQEGEALVISLSAEDQDGDDVTYSVAGNPAGGVLADSVFTWMPTSEQGGEYELQFTVTDDAGGEASETITITVEDINRPPTLEVPTEHTILAGEDWSFDLLCTDPDGDALVLTLIEAQPGCSLADTVLTWRPTTDQIGNHVLTLRLTDGKGGETTETISVTVRGQVPTNIEVVSRSSPTSWSASNYPNPFNSQTAVIYDVQSAGTVRLEVYDMNGRLVRSLVAGHFDPGSYRVTWDGTSKDRLRASSGIYLVVLRAPGVRQTHKMTLVK